MYQPKKLIQANDARVGGTLVPFTKFVVFVCCFLMGFLPLRLRAQTTFDVDLASFEHDHNVSGGTLNANQAGTFSFDLGSVADPANEVLGLKLDIALSDEAVLPTSSLALAFSKSWLFDDLEVSESISVDGSTRILHLELILSDHLPQSGHGFVFSFPVVSALNNVAANSLVVAVDGVVIVDNVDLKMAAPDEPFCYPNPSSGNLWVPILGAETLRLTGMDGRSSEVAVTDVGGIGMADIAGLAAGVYWVEVLSGNAVIFRQRVLRE
ncbi:MAG: hypothetical protein RLZZ519_3294 [Bacteroidota bacterium]|jgi:hypothetical protein